MVILVWILTREAGRLVLGVRKRLSLARPEDWCTRYKEDSKIISSIRRTLIGAKYNEESKVILVQQGPQNVPGKTYELYRFLVQEL